MDKDIVVFRETYVDVVGKHNDQKNEIVILHGREDTAPPAFSGSDSLVQKEKTTLY